MFNIRSRGVSAADPRDAARRDLTTGARPVGRDSARPASRGPAVRRQRLFFFVILRIEWLARLLLIDSRPPYNASSRSSS